jgi:hypothetical protein
MTRPTWLPWLQHDLPASRADAILIVGSQIRDEAPLLNARLRKAVKARQGLHHRPGWETTYPATFLARRRDPVQPARRCRRLSAAKRPAIIGGAALAKGALEAAWRSAASSIWCARWKTARVERLQRSAHGRFAHGR